MTDKETPLGYDEIEENVNTLKVKLMKDSTPLYQTLYSAVNSCPIDELTWKDPLASQVISNKSSIVENLSPNLKRHFWYKLFIIKKITHNGTWKESEKNISDIVKGAFTLLEEIWVNPTFNSDLARLLNEGTYQSTVIFLSIREILKNLPFGLFSFISTSERQSVVSSNRKGDGNIGRKPDIMYVIRYLDVFFKIMYGSRHL
ncbi:2000_t:CDS:2 [Entrophospora sp. SA101]|nr:2000_t:CDS:2 [Entrophospora sp. SA101]